MKKRLFLFFVILSATVVVTAQGLYETKSAQIKFFSSTPAEDIEATNNQVVSKLDGKTGQLSFLLLVKGFVFENELMQKHFNDEYMQSSKLPKAEFKGNISNINSINFTKDGTYPAVAEGSLTIHGITQPVKTTGTVTITGGKASLKSVFKIKLTDYGISDSQIGTSIAKELQLTVTAKYD